MRVSEVAYKLGIPAHYIHYWKKIGLIGGKHGLDFQDLIKIRFIRACQKESISLQRIRSALKTLPSPGSLPRVKSNSPDGSGEPSTLWSEGEWHRDLEIYGPGLLARREQNSLIVPESGQILFDSFSSKSSQSDFSGVSRVVTLESTSRESAGEGKQKELSQMEQRYYEALRSEPRSVLKKILKELLRKEPEHPGALIEMGNLYFEEDKLDQALEYYDQALQSDPDLAEAVYNIANIYFSQKKYAAAIRYFETCVHMDPGFPEPYYNLGVVHMALDRPGAAAYFFSEYLKLDADSSWSDEARAHLNELESMENLQQEAIAEDQGTLFHLYLPEE